MDFADINDGMNIKIREGGLTGWAQYSYIRPE